MSNPQKKEPIMLKMLHASSGHHNFDLINPDKKTQTTSSQQQTVTDSEALIEQQTRHAIQKADEAHQKKHENDKKSST